MEPVFTPNTTKMPQDKETDLDIIYQTTAVIMQVNTKGESQLAKEPYQRLGEEGNTAKDEMRTAHW